MGGQGVDEATKWEILRILQDARERIAKGWTQDAEARDAGGNIVPADDPKAGSWSLSGSLEAVAPLTDERILALYELCNALERQGWSRAVRHANNKELTSQKMALETLDNAIDDVAGA